MQYLNGQITVDPDIQFGKPVFTGTRVPVEILFQHLEAGDGLDIFLEDFPSVSREQAVNLLAQIEAILKPDTLSKLDATAA